jgi:hypothetical protein
MMRLMPLVLLILLALLVGAAPAQAVPCNPPRCVVGGGELSIGGANSAASAGGTNYSIHGASARFSGPGGSGSVQLPHAAEDITAGPDGAAYITVPRAQSIIRLDSRGATNSFRVAYQPRRIIAGPSRALWFTMQGGRSPVTLGRMSPYGAFYFFQLPIPAFDLRATGPNSLQLSGGGRHINFTAFLGAQPIRTHQMPISPWTFAGYARLKCPIDDYVMCAGEITMRHGGQVIGSGPFSLRVNDAPATRIIVNARGRALLRRGPLTAQATIFQRDQGGTTRTSQTTYRLFMRSKSSY